MEGKNESLSNPALRAIRNILAKRREGVSSLSNPALRAIRNGKNWVPVSDGDRLLFVRSIDPLCVLEVGNDWKCRQLTSPLTDPKYIGEYRGGGTARIEGGKIVGVGHRTVERPVLRHTPFEYTIDLSTWAVTVTDLPVDGFGDDAMFDPTCEIGAAIVMCCFQRSWWHRQRITHRFCEVVG